MTLGKKIESTAFFAEGSEPAFGFDQPFFSKTSSSLAQRFHLIPSSNLEI
jgi:hypothetical protein